MKLFFSAIVLISGLLSHTEVAAWQPVGNRIKTRWTNEVDPSCPLPEYPRPAMTRTRWMNLNGLWEYAIRPVSEPDPEAWKGRILVPFAVESALSGVQREVGPDHALWYRRTFTLPASWKDERILLHFGAVDYESEIYLNDIKIGCYRGGYTSFSLDLTPYLTRGAVSGRAGLGSYGCRTSAPRQTALCPGIDLVYLRDWNLADRVARTGG